MDLRQVLPSGQMLDGKYRIERVIGAGGFGITYAAHDLGLNTTIAIKEYYPAELGVRDSTMSVRPKSGHERGLFERLRASFVEEARTLAQFRHGSIVRVLSVFEAHGTAYMAMEFEDGRSLKAWMRELGRRPTQDELDQIFIPLLDALEALHQARFLHRDIAPDNIIIRPDGRPVLLDFGAARRVAATERSSQMTGLIKLGYSPQEQYTTDGKAQGAWTDIYALGATLYHAVTGAAPPESTVRFIEDTMTPAILAEGDWRQDFLAGIDHCLQVRPQDRPQSIAELRPLLFGDLAPLYTSTTRRPSRPLQAASDGNATVLADTSNRATSIPIASGAAPAQPASPAFRASVVATLLVLALLAAYQLAWRRPIDTAGTAATGVTSTNSAGGRVTGDRQAEAEDAARRRAADAAAASAADEARRERDRAEVQRRSADTVRQAEDAYREGVRLATGNGVAVDHARARVLFEQAAAAGRPDAMNWLGRMHQAGLGVTQNYALAREWFERAATAGDAASMVQIGLLHQNGQGVPQNYLDAREWFERAAAQGHTESFYLLGLLYNRGQGTPVDHVKAREQFERGAQSGHLQSILNLAIMLKSGQGGPVDLVKAREEYAKAAAFGSTAAMNSLGVIFLNGEGTDKDPATARIWYERAVAGGNSVAMLNLAHLLNRGQGGKVDPVRAAQLILDASRNRNDKAIADLAGTMARWTKEVRTELKRSLQRAGLYRAGAVNDVWDDAARKAAADFRIRGG